MTSGGNLYIESSDIGSDYIGTDFINSLGITFIDNGGNYEVSYISGNTQMPEYDLHLDYFGGNSPHFSVDRITALSNVMFTCEQGFDRMIMKKAVNYNVVSSSLVMGALRNGDSLNLKPYIVAKMVYDFLDFNPSVNIREPATDITSTHNFPNPVFNQTTIEFDLKTSGFVKINIFDTHGKMVNRLFDGFQLHGHQSIVWDCNNNQGERVSPGVYFYYIQTKNNLASGKLTVL